MPPQVQRASDLRPDRRPVDPDVVVPRAVREAAERAEAAHAQEYGAQPAPQAATPAPQNTDTITIADPPAASPAPQPQPPPPQVVTPTGNEPSPRPQLPAEAELELQRIRSAEGRKRVQLEQQLANAADRIAVLEQMVQEVHNRPADPQPAPVPQRLITEAETNEFGPEMLDVMGRRAKETISPELAELRNMVAQLEQKVTGTVNTVTNNARQTMLNQLDANMSNWKQVNMDARFKTWLALPDPYFGVSRHTALLSAFEKNDTPRVLNFFKGFVSELAAEDPDQVTPAADPSPAPAPAKPSLETLAAPGRARTSAQPNAPTEKQIITTADIDAFYDAVRRGAYRGRETEQAQLEAELFLAQREGRVRTVQKK